MEKIYKNTYNYILECPDYCKECNDGTNCSVCRPNGDPSNKCECLDGFYKNID